MNQIEMDKNLMVVTAIQGYAENHHIAEVEAYELFARKDLLTLIRSQYEALHTQPLEECINFVEDVLARCDYR